MSSLAPITSTCEPRPDVLSGGLTDAHFAAQLDQVVRSPEKYPVYGDPSEFFAITFPTAGLKELLSSTFGRLSGKAGQIPGAEHGVVRFQTSFGGGKTHGLIAAYHLATGARPMGVEEFADPDLLPDECSVAAVVGDSLDALSGLDVNGHQVQTMWGAIAAQLGAEAWEAVAAHDVERSAPGTATWEGIFEDAPTLVIIDEIAAHLRALSSSGSEDLRRQAEAVPAFLYDLFTAAARVDTARVIITLATAQDAFGQETSAIEKTLNDATEASADTKSVIARFREILVPAADEEIAGILRRRLFRRIDTEAAVAAGAAFQEFYGEVERREIQLGFDADIAGQVARSYPLHPELVKVLDSRVGTIPEFQRTRGALRLLAETVAALWDKDTKALLINVADLPLDAAPVSAALTRGIGREEFAPVVDADVAGPTSHAAVIDRSRFPGATPYATRAASTVFLHSLERTAATGATLVDVWRGTLAPGDDPDLVEEALRLLDQSAWHLSYDTSRYRFQTEPNPRKIVGDEKAAVLASVVREEIDHRIGVMFASAGPVKVKIFPHGPYDVDDKPELRLAVVHYDDLTVDARTASPTPLQLADMLDQFGVAGANRTYRNGIVFLVADTGQVDAMRETVRYHLAAQRIVSDGQRMARYAEEVQKQLRAIADKANHHLRHHEQAFFSGHDTVVVFTQFTDTLNWLRDELKGTYGSQIACYTGSGGSRWNPDRQTWDKLPKEEVKELFRAGKDVKILLGTDAMSEGLNLQTTARLINYDMPWNFMRVEQRIGRIDRIGGRPTVSVTNYFYKDTVEEKVYSGIKEDAEWFDQVVGPAQPVLGKVESVIEDIAMRPASDARDQAIQQELEQVRHAIAAAEERVFTMSDIENTDVGGAYAAAPAVTLDRIEQVLTSNLLSKDVIHPHPDFEHTFYIEVEGQKYPMTFDRDVYDRNSEIGFMTYRHPVFESLLDGCLGATEA